MERQTVFRINDNNIGPELLTQVFLERGWIEYDEEHHGDHGWHLWWKTNRFRTSEYASLLPWQRINHFPSCGAITKKDALCRNFRKMRIVHGVNVFNFSPQAYNLPNDYTKFVSDYAKLSPSNTRRDRGRVVSYSAGVGQGYHHSSNPNSQDHHDNRLHPHHHNNNNNSRNQQSASPAPDAPLMWICKPAESSRGRGIFIFQDLSELQYDCNAVVQQYISDPLLIGGYKFDIRVYVAVMSFSPLQIYIHEEGLVRFSTEKYDLDRPDNVFAHLTNTSINKFSPGYTTDKEEIGHGCKWTISQLRRYFLQNNMCDELLWQKITNIVILTILMQAPSAPKNGNCFELYGFDILVDTHMKPWLLEVNLGPALSSDCHADLLAKKSMLHDLLDLVHSDPTSRGGASNEEGGAGGVGGLGLGRDLLLTEDSQIWDERNGVGAGEGTGRISYMASLDTLTDRTSASVKTTHRSYQANGKSNMSNHSSRYASNVQSDIFNGSHYNISFHNSSHMQHDRSGDNVRQCTSDEWQQQTPREAKRTRKKSACVSETGDAGHTSNIILPYININGRRGSLTGRESSSSLERNNNYIEQSLEEGYKEDGKIPGIIGLKDTVGNGNSKIEMAELSVQQVESKTSNVSDSGVSSASNSSGEAFTYSTAGDTPHSARVQSGSEQHLLLNKTYEPNNELPQSGNGKNERQDSGYDGNCNLDADLIQRLSDISSSLNITGGGDTIGAVSPRGEGDNTDTHVLVHGNIRRRGSKRLVVPTPETSTTPAGSNSPNINRGMHGNSGHTNNNNGVIKQSTPLMRRKSMGGSNKSLHSITKNTTAARTPSGSTISSGYHSGYQTHGSPRTSVVSAASTTTATLRKQQNQRSRPPPKHQADERQARLYAIPRNFSRTEAARFPHSFHHHHQHHHHHNSRYHSNNSLYYNINHNNISQKHLTPVKKVGRFYLVFPFNELSLSLSQGKLDPKVIIKEVQRHYKEIIKRYSSSHNKNIQDKHGKECGTKPLDPAKWPQIWAPLNKTNGGYEFC